MEKNYAQAAQRYSVTPNRGFSGVPLRRLNQLVASVPSTVLRKVISYRSVK
jgi:hypothetical protein